MPLATRAQVSEWRSLAETARLEHPGWWHRIEDYIRPTKTRRVTTRARVAVAAHIAASHEAVPAMAEMLERAAAIIEACEAAGGIVPSGIVPGAADWLREWRGE